MPLRDRTPRPYRSLPKLGSIRKGTKTDKGFPTDLDHFNLEEAPAVARVYPSDCRELLVYVPLPTPAENFSAYYELWGKSGAKCRGDGVHLTSALEPVGIHFVVMDGSVVQDYIEEDGRAYSRGEKVPCSGRAQDLYERCKECSASGSLMVMVRNPAQPRLLVEDQWGYYTLRFGSLHDIDAIEGQLETYERIARAAGLDGLQGLPLILRRVARQMSYPDAKNNQRATKEDWALQLEIDPDWMGQIMEAAQRHTRAQIGSPDVAALTSGVSIDEASGELVTEGEIVDTAVPWEDPFDASPIADLVNKMVNELDGEGIYRVKKYLMALPQDETGLTVEKHYVNRMKERFGTSSSAEINKTVGLFLEWMATPHDQWEEWKAGQTE